MLAALRQRRRPGSSRKAIPLRVFAAGLYLLLRDHLHVLDRITIDTEYVGHDANIKGMLLSLIWRVDPAYPGDRIEFSHVGKQSPAHDLAWKVNRGRCRANRVVTKNELLNLL